MEDVRLVVWDLDDTFWNGNISEGGFRYSKINHDIILELARRGIVSSICSKNDHAAIARILKKSGLWDYFIFPSIDWTAKGPRLAAMAKSVQLRPSTILFIDDNPMNRAEAVHFVKGIQVADPSFIPDMLSSPSLQGKYDVSLTRLNQYKILERRADNIRMSSDVTDFLRESEIRVFIDHNVNDNIDRAIELINRTNQLNFTKKRLPENLGRSRKGLRNLIDQYNMQSALIRVKDKYGDYGYCGFYAHEKTVHADPELIHYCFSCRILGMGIESWLYQRLGRPPIQVVGEVLTDLHAPARPIDWIHLNADTSVGTAPAPPATDGQRIFIRGGCELTPLAHYFGLLSDEVVEEFAFNRADVTIRRDHSEMLRLALETPSEDQMIALERLGYLSTDFTSAISSTECRPDVYIFSFWADMSYPLFRHRTLDFRVPFFVAHIIEGVFDLTQFDAELPMNLNGHWIADAISEIKENYIFEGLIDEDSFINNVTDIMKYMPPDARVFLLCMNEHFIEPDGRLGEFPQAIALNRRLHQIVDTSPNVTLLNIEDHVMDVGDRNAGDPNHFSRKVYFRLYEDIRYRISIIPPVAGDINDSGLTFAPLEILIQCEKKPFKPS